LIPSSRASRGCWTHTRIALNRSFSRATLVWSRSVNIALLREEGYRGGITILRDYIRRIRPPKQPVYLKLHFAPGECAQVDWGAQGTVAVGNTSRRLSFFVMVLAFSRQIFVEFTVSQTMEHFLSCHEHAFAAFGGVPSKIMVDNLKSAVLQRLAGSAPVFNPRYQDFARHHGFTIAPCNVARGNEKGRVESGVGYVKKNFLRGLKLTEFSAIQAAAQVWLDTIANVRIHGETHFLIDAGHPPGFWPT
jgi:transposase